MFLEFTGSIDNIGWIDASMDGFVDALNPRTESQRVAVPKISSNTGGAPSGKAIQLIGSVQKCG